MREYVNDKKRSKISLEKLKTKIRNNPEEAGKYLVESEMGRFMLGKIEKNVSEVLRAVKLKKGDMFILEIDSLEGLISWLINQSENIKVGFQKLNVSEDELVLAARWWDKKQKDSLLDSRDSLGRPGIGWGLMFGYTPTLDKYSEDLSIQFLVI